MSEKELQWICTLTREMDVINIRINKKKDNNENTIDDITLSTENKCTTLRALGYWY